MGLALAGCDRQTKQLDAMQSRIDSLELELAHAYKPGFGEFMTGIQAHHAKLWFAGQNQNWPLADFEVHEIMESVQAIQDYETDREESQVIGMINPALDSVMAAIEEKNTIGFTRSYSLLTNTCNACHREVQFEFNVVTIPTLQTFSNQDFKPNP